MRSLFFVIIPLVACGGDAIVSSTGNGGAGGTGGTSTTTTSMSTSSNTSMSTSSMSSMSSSMGGSMGPSMTSASGLTCAELTDNLTDALDKASACDSCSDGPDTCEYFSGIELTDPCGCPSPVNFDSMETVQQAIDAFNTWKAQGCGPLECGTPCAISKDPLCTSLGGGCEGRCLP